MEVDLVDVEEVKSRKGGRERGAKYAKYTQAIKRHVPWIKEEIEKTADGTIRIKTVGLRKELGGEFLKKKETAIYWGLKYALFKEGIIVDTGSHKDGNKILIIRFATEDDILPPSLIKMADEEARDVLVDKVETFNEEAELREQKKNN